MVRIDENASLLKQIAALYQEVWNKEDRSWEERLVRHSGYEGFRGFAALNDNGEIVGYSYGYTSLPGQFYHNLMAKEFAESEYDKWLKGCFEFVELAVHPAHRNQGLAKELINLLLDGVVHKTAVLTTQQTNHSAQKLYERLGWHVLKHSFYPSAEGEPYVIMGRRLTT
ncbi:GNAT family N-acetyltransferase [Mesobacillus subterraneus]|uniref:GNAT family N-acetyltransferase n=1 Tax=Mesobacillus subterraneus TaxID=285983 RepID=A0A3R9EDG3_9BACI|nr:GNAT family N-acetyltransferase [Mesobacillus subterraneus]